MHELEKQNSILVAEANRILHSYSLLRIMEKYGSPFVTGSYVLGLMTWRDLDINLDTADMTEKAFFQMGGEIAAALKPWRMSFRNELLGKTPGLPLGFYFGVHTRILGDSKDWKIDIWSMNTEQINQVKQEFSELQTEINTTNRMMILEIKNQLCHHPEFLVGIHSLDIYNAVLKHGINTVEQFSRWIKESKGIDLSAESPRYSRVFKEGH
jgi:hypothetical protein